MVGGNQFLEDVLEPMEARVRVSCAASGVERPDERADTEVASYGHEEEICRSIVGEGRTIGAIAKIVSGCDGTRPDDSLEDVSPGGRQQAKTKKFGEGKERGANKGENTLVKVWAGGECVAERQGVATEA